MVEPGTHRFEPGNATLSVRTRRGGAAAKAGHDLLLHVTAWEGTLTIGDDGAPSAAELVADATSLRVQEGTGGMKALDDDDKANIHQTIDDEVLQRRDIAFRSSAIDGGRADGELTIGDRTRPLSLELEVADDGTVRASATVRQSDWGVKPYSALFGTLKVLDEVEVALEGHL
ncbi:MAG TPA: YceI family protein [Solirubrobacteraceae bacterium]|nr:YceI family protein [Solirubrobacteraceae bacterium]